MVECTAWDTLTIEIDGGIGLVTVSGSYGGNGRIAEAGVNHDTYSGSFGINGDYNKDNKVDIIDFGTFGADYGTAAAQSDFNGSGGAVDIIDFGFSVATTAWPLRVLVVVRQSLSPPALP